MIMFLVYRVYKSYEVEYPDYTEPAFATESKETASNFVKQANETISKLSAIYQNKNKNYRVEVEVVRDELRALDRNWDDCTKYVYMKIEVR